MRILVLILSLSNLGLLAAKPAPQEFDNFLGGPPLSKEDTTPVVLNKRAHYKTSQEACQAFKKTFISSTEDVFYVDENCLRHRVTDPNFLDFLSFEEKQTVLEVEDNTLVLLKKGDNLTLKSYLAQHTPARLKLIKSVCRKYNEKVVTGNSDQFFYLKNCIRFRLKDYGEAEKMKKELMPFDVIPSVILSFISMGPMIKAPDIKTDTVLLGADTYQNACHKFKKRFAAFYSQFFFIDHCIMRPIDEQSITAQQEFQKQNFTVANLSSQDIMELQDGASISLKEAMGQAYVTPPAPVSSKK